MRTLHTLVAIAALVHATSALAGAKPDPKATALADRIVGEVAGVKAGEVVFIVGTFDDRALISDLYVAVGKKGGVPMIRIDDPALGRRWIDEVPAANDKTLATMEQKLVPLPDVILLVDRRDPAASKDVAPERLTSMSALFIGLEEMRFKRGTRSVSIGNGLFPSKWAAKEVGLSEGDLKKVFEAGLATDYKALGVTADTVKAAMPAGKEVVIKTKAGTDLKLKLSKAPMHVSDGVISADEIKTGGASLLSWIPAGEVYGLVEAGSAEGKIVQPRFTFEGEDIKDLTVEVKAGKVVSMSAKPSKTFDRFKALYDASTAGKDLVSVLDVGVNPDAKVKGKAVQNFIPAGTITLGWGGDVWAGGTNTSPGGALVFLTDATLTVDGAVLVDAGTLKVPAAK